MSAKNCRCCESHPLSYWLIAAGMLVFAAPAFAGLDWYDLTAGGAPYCGSVGCPVSTSIGEYYFAKPLLNLGGR